MASLDAAKTMPDAHTETMNDHFQNSRWYTPLPTLHVSFGPFTTVIFGADSRIGSSSG